MKKNHKVRQLSIRDDPALIDIFTQSFQTYPHMPILCEHPNSTMHVINNLLFVYGQLHNTLRFGITENDKLVCASFNIDSSFPNSLIISYRFLLSLAHSSHFKGIGLRCIKEYYQAQKHKPPIPEPQLEILLIGTYPSYEHKGYGTSMLQYLYTEAKKRKYKGLIGFTRADRAAFQLYMKHGWIVDKEFTIGDKQFCWIRYKI